MTGRGARLPLATLTLLAVAGVAVSAAIPKAISAQITIDPVASSPGVASDAEMIAVNLALSGLAAGIIRSVRGESFWDGLALGAAGGGVGFVGKSIAASGFDGAGFLGREVAAVGASMVRNAAFADGPLDTLVLPIGPTRLYLTRGGSSLRVDAEEIALLVWASFDGRYRFDAGRSLSAGSAVFLTDDAVRRPDGTVNGRAFSGLIIVNERAVELSPGILGHESVHVSQIDYLKIVGGLPTESWLVGRVEPGRSRVVDWLDLGVGHYPHQALLTGQLFLGATPDFLEREAERLQRH